MFNCSHRPQFFDYSNSNFANNQTKLTAQPQSAKQRKRSRKKHEKRIKTRRRRRSRKKYVSSRRQHAIKVARERNAWVEYKIAVRCNKRSSSNSNSGRGSGSSMVGISWYRFYSIAGRGRVLANVDAYLGSLMWSRCSRSAITFLFLGQSFAGTRLFCFIFQIKVSKCILKSPEMNRNCPDAFNGIR